jgi:DNA (cytosine-5)-methyltransferase 1
LVIELNNQTEGKQHDNHRSQENHPDPRPPATRFSCSRNSSGWPKARKADLQRGGGMSLGAYYNEIDPVAAQWLRNLITAGHIAPGLVDERSIEDVTPEELKGFTQCHFFAGIGVWSLALRRAGWPDDREIWTGSCPCQPFSSSGQKGGFDDERHLWPAFHWLVEQRQPRVVIGEQVASKAAEPWLDLVQTDMEALDYAFGAIAFPSAGVGAPHIRDRTYWVGNANEQGSQGQSGHDSAAGRQGPGRPVAETGLLVGLANANSAKRKAWGGNVLGIREPANAFALPGSDSGLADAEHDGRSRPEADTPEPGGNKSEIGVSDGGYTALEGQPAAGPTNGFWRDADWLGCRDAKWRPVEPGTFPLAHGATARVGRLRAYGNAINAEAATQFISAFMEADNAINHHTTEQTA